MSQDIEQDMESRLLEYASKKGDATIYSYMKAYRMYGDTLLVVLEKLVYALATEKDRLFKSAMDAHNGNVNPIIVKTNSKNHAVGKETT